MVYIDEMMEDSYLIIDFLVQRVSALSARPPLERRTLNKQTNKQTNKLSVFYTNTTENQPIETEHI